VQIMTNIYKILIITVLLLFITSCSSVNSVYKYSSNDKTIYFGKDAKNIIPIELTNPIIKYHNSFSCNPNSYTLSDENKEYGRLFIEYINLSSDCKWNGLASGFFESNVKSQLKLDSMKTVEEFDISSYSFKTFKINNDLYLSIIYLYGGRSDRFILDYNGKLYTKLLKSFKPDYKSNINFQKRFLGNYDDSLVRKNIINEYFQEERWRITPSIGIRITL